MGNTHKFTKSHNCTYELPNSVNCTLVKNNSEFNYCCWMWTNGKRSPHQHVHSYALFLSRKLYINGVFKNAEISHQSSKNTAHT